MVNVATARFFNSPFNLEKLMSNFRNEEARNAFYDALEHEEYQVRFNKIGEPFKITANVMDYTAGYITWKNKRWFFFVDYWNVINENIIEVYYTIDAWETYAYGSDIKFGHYHTYRTAHQEMGQYKNYFAPVYMETDLHYRFDKGFDSSTNPMLLYVVYDDTNNEARYGWYSTTPGLVFGGASKTIIDEIKTLDALSDNIRLISAFITPFCDDEIGGDEYFVISDHHYLSKSGHYHIPSVDLTGLNFVNGRYTKYKVLDKSAVEIWRASDKRRYISMHAELNLSYAGATWRCEMLAEGSENPEIFTFPLNPIDIISDAWAQYYVQRRNYDVQTRQIASQQQLVNGVVGNAIGGGIAGATAGPIAGLIGAIAGVAGSVAGYATDTAIFNPRIQSATDELYKKASDTLNLDGEGYTARFISGVYSEFWDSETQRKNDVAIAENGYINDEYGAKFTYKENGPFAGDVQITGIPRVASNQIRQRLVNGVIFNKGD